MTDDEVVRQPHRVVRTAPVGGSPIGVNCPVCRVGVGPDALLNRPYEIQPLPDGRYRIVISGTSTVVHECEQPGEDGGSVREPRSSPPGPGTASAERPDR
jgi:hypothetical protein